MLTQFRDFVLRGNVIDLAVAVVIGAAFGSVVDAAVADLVTPLIAAIGGQPDFGELSFTVNGSRFRYGDFINAALAFLTVAAVVFLLVVRPMNALMAEVRREEAPASAAPSEDVVLLTEIRDLLREAREEERPPHA